MRYEHDWHYEVHHFNPSGDVFSAFVSCFNCSWSRSRVVVGACKHTREQTSSSSWMIIAESKDADFRIPPGKTKCAINRQFILLQIIDSGCTNNFTSRQSASLDCPRSMSTAGALPITRYSQDIVTTAREVIFVLVVEKLFLSLQAFDFANVNYPGSRATME